MGVHKKDFIQCQHCGRKSIHDGAPEGFLYVVTSNGFHYIRCPCGILTRGCQTIHALQELWNSRSGRPYVAPTVTVKHPPIRGLEEGVLEEDGPETQDPDEF